MKPKKYIILISLSIFISSFFFTAFKVTDLGEIKDYRSIEVFLIGPISFLGGGVLELLVWTANIWFFAALLGVYKNKYRSSILRGFIGICISFSFICWKEILVAENGRMAEIHSLEVGYFLWLFSILFITISSVYLKFITKKTLI